MEIKKLILGLSAGIILSGCVQSTAMIGPAITLASSGNVSQAGLTFFTNKAVEKETGMDTVSYVSNKIDENRVNEVINKIVINKDGKKKVFFFFFYFFIFYYY